VLCAGPRLLLRGLLRRLQNHDQPLGPSRPGRTENEPGGTVNKRTRCIYYVFTPPDPGPPTSSLLAIALATTRGERRSRHGAAIRSGTLCVENKNNHSPKSVSSRNGSSNPWVIQPHTPRRFAATFYRRCSAVPTSEGAKRERHCETLLALDLKKKMQFPHGATERTWHGSPRVRSIASRHRLHIWLKAMIHMCESFEYPPSRIASLSPPRCTLCHADFSLSLRVWTGYPPRF
jgi:hypothetical protein